MNEYMEHASYTWSNNSIRLSVTPSAIAKSIYFYVQETGYFETEYPYFTERENLNSFLIVFTISGVGYLEYQKNIYTLEKGQCFFIHCMEHHRYWTSKEAPWEIVWLHFNGNNALGYYEQFIKLGFHILTFMDSFFIESTMRRITALHNKRDITTELVTSKLIVDLLTELTIHNTLPEESDPFMPELIKKVMKDIDKHFKEPVRIELIAERNGTSKFHLSREFKKHTGTTVKEYLISTRLSYAKELLKYTDKTISEITYDCGMNNISHFINLFKARENITPLSYKKEWKNK